MKAINSNNLQPFSAVIAASASAQTASAESSFSEHLAQQPSRKSAAQLNESMQQARGTMALLDAMDEFSAPQKRAKMAGDLAQKLLIQQANSAKMAALAAAKSALTKQSSTAAQPAAQQAQPAQNFALAKPLRALRQPFAPEPLSAPKSRYSAKELAALREQTDAFEAFMIKSMLDVAMPPHENPLFGKDAGDDIYRDMYHDALAKAMGGGMGLSEILFKHLTES